MLQKSLLEVASQERPGTESKTTYNSLIIDAYGRYLWKAVSPEASNTGTPKLELKVRRVCTTDGRPQPLPVIQMYSANASNYTSRPNIHYLFYFLHALHKGQRLLQKLQNTLSSTISLVLLSCTKVQYHYTCSDPESSPPLSRFPDFLVSPFQFIDYFLYLTVARGTVHWPTLEIDTSKIGKLDQQDCSQATDIPFWSGTGLDQADRIWGSYRNDRDVTQGH